MSGSQEKRRKVRSRSRLLAKRRISRSKSRSPMKRKKSESSIKSPVEERKCRSEDCENNKQELMAKARTKDKQHDKKRFDQLVVN